MSLVKYIQYLFTFVFMWELGVYTAYAGREQMIVFDTWDMQEIRLTLMMLSVLFICLAEMMKEPA